MVTVMPVVMAMLPDKDESSIAEAEDGVDYDREDDGSMMINFNIAPCISRSRILAIRCDMKNRYATAYGLGTRISERTLVSESKPNPNQALRLRRRKTN